MLVAVVQLLYDVIHQMVIKLDKTDKIEANSDCQGRNGQTQTALYAYKFAF